jgi:hypothetical protein
VFRTISHTPAVQMHVLVIRCPKAMKRAQYND